jgi:hypothetical protein
VPRARHVFNDAGELVMTLVAHFVVHVGLAPFEATGLTRSQTPGQHAVAIRGD